MRSLDSSLISFIVPVYNVASFLHICVDSIINQTYRHLEIILVDDGSTDKSGIICDMLAEKDDRISVVHQTNGGLSDARNTGLDLAKGDFICFVDSDDVIHDRYAEILLSNIGTADMIFCDYVEIESSDNVIFCKESNGQQMIVKRTFTSSQALSNIDNLVLKNSPVVVVAWNKLYRKKIWEKIRFPKGKIHEDEFVIHHVIAACKTLAFISEKLYYYRQHPNSIMQQTAKSRRAAEHKIEAFMERRSFLLQLDMQREVMSLNTKILYCLMQPIIPVNLMARNDVSVSMIFFQNNLRWVYRILLCLKKYNCGLYWKIIKLLKG